jgi:hypothetical protein
MTTPHTPLPDPPEPVLDEIQQVDPPTMVIPAVPVDVQGPVHVRLVPNRRVSVDAFPMTTAPQAVVRRDEQRAKVTMVSAVAWQMSTRNAGTKAPIPANVVITVTHEAEIWASVGSAGSADILAVICEYI